MVSKKHSVVFSGSVLGIEEEYSPGSNAFVDDEGNIVSSVSGVALENEKNRTIDVVTRRGVSPMSIGTQIYGRVVLVTDHAAVIEICSGFEMRPGFCQIDQGQISFGRFRESACRVCFAVGR